MKLKKIGNNETEITTSEGNLLFFSYDTLVALKIKLNVYVTEKKHSRTTTGHINKWLYSLGIARLKTDGSLGLDHDRFKTTTVTQQDLEALIKVSGTIKTYEEKGLTSKLVKEYNNEIKRKKNTQLR